MGTSLFAVMFVMLFIYRRIVTAGSYVTITGKAFRPRVDDVGRLRYLLLGVCVLYLSCRVVLPIATLLYASVQKIAVAFPAAEQLHPRELPQGAVDERRQLGARQQPVARLWTATIGVAADGASRLDHLPLAAAGRGLIEYIVMFPQAVPRLIFAFGMMWAWLVFPIPIYGTLWLLLIAYLTVFLPLGVRTISGVMLQIDKSLDECAQMCGAGLGVPHAHRDSIPLLVARPGRGLAAAVRRQRARAGRLDPADGAALEGDHAVDRRILVRDRFASSPPRWR